MRRVRMKSLRTAAVLIAAAALAGCASLYTVDADVSSFSRWPAGRGAVDLRVRAPAVAAGAAAADADARGRGAAGARRRRPASPRPQAARPTSPSRSARASPRPTARRSTIPFWYGGVACGTGRSRYGRYGRPFWGPGWRWRRLGPVLRLAGVTSARSAVLIRDKRSGEPLYEARAESAGTDHGRGDDPAGDVRRRDAGLPGRQRRQPAPGHASSCRTEPKPPFAG